MSLKTKHSDVITCITTVIDTVPWARVGDSQFVVPEYHQSLLCSLDILNRYKYSPNRSQIGNQSYVLDILDVHLSETYVALATYIS
jgi:hypothetical protein